MYILPYSPQSEKTQNIFSKCLKHFLEPFLHKAAKILIHTKEVLFFFHTSKLETRVEEEIYNLYKYAKSRQDCTNKGSC